MSSSPLYDDARAKRNVSILIAAQAILGSQITMVFVIGGLAGVMLTPIACLATLPISMVVFGSMTTAPWLSRVMAVKGRRFGFILGALGGAIGSLIAAYAVSTANFWLLLLGSYLTGTYMSAQGFFRFAGADLASPAFRPKAISWVMAGGLLSAVIGPQIVSYTNNLTLVPFVGTYLAGAALSVIGLPLLMLLDIPINTAALKAKAQQSWAELLKRPTIAAAVICGAITYALMNLIMTSTPIAMVGCGFMTSDAANAVTLHVLGMYAPSFVTGHLIARFGAQRIMTTGMLFLVVACAVNIAGINLANFFIGMVLLGIGWNFGFIGATSLLSTAYSDAERTRVQGMNDAIVFGCVTIASVSSGGMMNCLGADIVSGWSTVNLAMLPFIALSCATLFWLHLRKTR